MIRWTGLAPWEFNPNPWTRRPWEAYRKDLSDFLALKGPAAEVSTLNPKP